MAGVFAALGLHTSKSQVTHGRVEGMGRAGNELVEGVSGIKIDAMETGEFGVLQRDRLRVNRLPRA